MAKTSGKATSVKRATKKTRDRKASPKSTKTERGKAEAEGEQATEAKATDKKPTTTRRTRKRTSKATTDSAPADKAKPATTRKKRTTRGKAAAPGPEQPAAMVKDDPSPEPPPEQQSNSQPNTTKAASRKTTRKTSASKTTTRKTATRKTAARRGASKAQASQVETSTATKAPAAKIELVQLEGQDGQTKRKQKQNRRRSSEAAATTTSQVAAETPDADEAIAESTAAPPKPAGLRSKTMARASRGTKRKAAGEEKAPVKTTPSRRKALKRYGNTLPKWPAKTELLGLRFRVKALETQDMPPPLGRKLHGWFLNSMKTIDPELSKEQHDDDARRGFTISQLTGPIATLGDQLRFEAEQSYEFTITAMTQPVVAYLKEWLKQLPATMQLDHLPMQIETVELALPPLGYGELNKVMVPKRSQLALSFRSTTSFKRRGNHFALPLPSNLFGSYVRRWNRLAETGLAKVEPVDEATFLDWVDEHVLVARHVIHSEYEPVGKAKGEGKDRANLGGITGFVGAVVLQLSGKAQERPEFVELWWRLGQAAPYFGTGVKTGQGLGQTVLGWELPETEAQVISRASLIAQRRAELVEIFWAQRKQQGARARKGAETWATILARREQGESLMDIAKDLGLSHETTNKYAKLARRALRAEAEAVLENR